MNFFCCLVLFSILSFASFSKTIYAVDFFDNFLIKDENKWSLENEGYSLRWDGSVIDGTYGWYFDSGKLFGEAGYKEMSYIYPKYSVVNNFDFSCKAINYNGVDQSFRFHVSQDKKSYYEVNYRYNEPDWSQDNNNITLWKTVNGVSRDITRFCIKEPFVYDLEQNVEHDIRFTVENRIIIKIYFDSSLVMTYIDSTPIPSGGFALKNWGGNFNADRVKNSFDNVHIVDLDNQIDLTNKKVIIIPGLSASWNSRGILGSDDPDLVWEIPFFVKHYENLKNAFISNGYIENQNLYVWAYDWRKPVSNIVQNLDAFIDNVTDDDDEIVLIGHSLGGLTARLWYQQNLTDSRIEKVISLGSPHYGSVDAYEAWNGGNVTRSGLQSIAYNMIILLNKSRTESVPDVIHRIAPVVQDLQPTFDFAYKDNNLVPFGNLTDSNSYLALKNIVDTNSLDKLNTFIGLGVDTKQFISLSARSFFDKRLGIWPDGHIVNTIYSSFGDNTVLSSSARMGDNFYELNSNHGDLPNNSINQIMNLLNLSTDNFSMIDYGDIDSKLIFYIASPAHLDVTCGTNKYLSDSLGFVVVDKELDFSDCSVKVVADGEGGDYKLIVGDTSNSWWSKYSGNVGLGQIDQYWFDKSALLVKNDDVFDVYKKYCLSLLNEYPGDFDLENCILSCDQKNADMLLDSVFDFRQKNRAFNISNEMLDKLIPLMSENDMEGSQAEYLLKNGNDMFNLIELVADIKEEKGVETDTFGVESFDLAKNIFKNANQNFSQNNYNELGIRFDLAKRILRQIW